MPIGCRSWHLGLLGPSRSRSKHPDLEGAIFQFHAPLKDGQRRMTFSVTTVTSEHQKTEPTCELRFGVGEGKSS